MPYGQVSMEVQRAAERKETDYEYESLIMNAINGMNKTNVFKEESHSM